MSLPPPTRVAPVRMLRDGHWIDSNRNVIGETALAIVVNGSAEAVMMATRADLEDFALGFALTERLVPSLKDVRELEIVEAALGVELRLWLTPEASTTHRAHRARRTGPVGCGLCGVESLEEAMRPIPVVTSSMQVNACALVAATRALSERQPMNAATRAAHAAAFFYRQDCLDLTVREDIGRHNALDKLVGALTRSETRGEDGVVLLTSRVSIELIQKTAFLGAPILAAISAPSALAIDAADRAGITLCGVVRDNGLEVFTHTARVT